MRFGFHQFIRRFSGPPDPNQPVEGEFVVIEFTLAQRKARDGEYLLFLSDCDERSRTDAQAVKIYQALTRMGRGSWV